MSNCYFIIKLSNFIIVFSFVLFSTIVSATENKFENREGFYYGINLGMYLASNKDAMYYNGAPDKQNSIDRVLDYNVSYSYEGGYRTQLENLLNDKITSFEYPTNMNYEPALLFGLTGGYNITNNWGTYFDFNYAKLKTNGVFTMNLLGPPETISIIDKNQAKGSIVGKEARLMMNVGVHKAFDIDNKNKIMPYFDAAINFMYTKVDEHSIYYQSFKANLINYTYDLNYQPLKEQSGWGTGVLVGAGIQMPLSEKFYSMFGYELLITNNGITPTEKNNNHSIFIRFFF